MAEDLHLRGDVVDQEVDEVGEEAEGDHAPAQAVHLVRVTVRVRAGARVRVRARARVRARVRVRVRVRVRATVRTVEMGTRQRKRSLMRRVSCA